METAAAPGTEIEVSGLSPHRAVADQYRYLELLDTVEGPKTDLERSGDKNTLSWSVTFSSRVCTNCQEPLNIPVLGPRIVSPCRLHDGSVVFLININPKFVPRIMEGVFVVGLVFRLLRSSG